MWLQAMLSVGATGTNGQRGPRSACAVVELLVVFILAGCGGGTGPPSSGRTSDEPDSPVSAERVLERMFAVYRECQTYADNAIYRERWVLREDGVVREPPPQMVSVSFERRAKVRIVRRLPDAEGGIAEQALLVSNGSRIYHSLPQFPQQILQTTAPVVLTGDNVAAAPRVAEGLFFAPLEDSFPQLDLLLSSEPQDEALAVDPTPRILEDGMIGDRPCYRVSLSSNAGQRVYWIDQESYLLRRLDLASGSVRQALDPFDQLQGFERWIEFTDATVNQDLPSAAFELEVPEDAVVVRRWVEGYPGPAPIGPDVPPQERDQYTAQLARYEAALAAASESGDAAQMASAAAEIAPASEPTAFRLHDAWQADGVRQPGSLYALYGAEGTRILVIDGLTAVAELSPDGGLLQRHVPSALNDAAIDRLSTNLDTHGGRWFAVGGLGQQRVHLFDSAWNHQGSFPEHDNPGIGDFLFAPFGETESPQLVVGFWADLGVHAFSLAGKRLWVDRSLQQVWALALVWSDGQNPTVWTAHGREVVGRVGPDGPLSPLVVSGRAVVELAAADLDGDSRSEVCGVAYVEPGVYDAIGLDETGREVWSYRLPKGEFIHSGGRRIVAARDEALTGWVLPAADGSIHVLGADGELIDAFHTGRAINGLEVVGEEGRPLLILSSPEGVIAWHLERSP